MNRQTSNAIDALTNALNNSLDGVIINNIFSPQLLHIRQLILLCSQLAAFFLNADAGSAWLIDGDKLLRAAIINRPPELLNSFTIPINEGIAGMVVREKEPVIINDVKNDKRFVHPEYTLKEDLNSFIGCPLIICSSCIGMMGFFRHQNNGFTKDSVAVLTSICALMSLSIQHCSMSHNVFPQWETTLINMCNLPFDHHRSKDASREILQRTQPLWLGMSPLPKGINPMTLTKLQHFLFRREMPVTAEDVAASNEISVATARRYLNYLYKSNFVNCNAKYSAVGHPVYCYSILSPFFKSK